MTIPQLRTSQIVTTFGPGAMVDLPDASVIVAGLDHWRYDPNQLSTVDEPRLVDKLRRILGVQTLTLRTPPPASDLGYGFRPDITAWRFPEWFIVQHTPVVTPNGFRRRRLVNLNSLDGAKYRDADGRKHQVVPVRFVRACKKGHVGDIDWPAVVHGAAGACVRDWGIEAGGTTGARDRISGL